MLTEVDKARFRASFVELKNLLAENNYPAAAAISTEMTAAAVYADSPEYIFIWEFFEWLFLNTPAIVDLREIKRENADMAIKEINNSVNSLIDTIINVYPPLDDKQLRELFNKMVSTRFTVTKHQSLAIRHLSNRRIRPLGG